MRDKPIKIVVPYNFIPLSSWVYTPDWAEKACHDIPFKDGISGKIRYRLKNSTPICVGHQKNAEGVLDWEKDADGRYVIPGSSVKGMLRTALEIVSFGRMECFHNRKHATRCSIGDVMNSDNSKFERLPVLVKPGKDGYWKYFVTEYNPDMKPVCASVKIDNLNLGLNQDSKAADKLTEIMKLYGRGGKLPIVYAEIKDRDGLSKNQQKKNVDKQRKTYWKEVVSISENKDEKHRHAGMFLFMDKNVSNNGNNPKANKYTDYFFIFDEDKLKDPCNWKALDIDLIKDLKQSMAPLKNGEDTLFDRYCTHMNDIAGFPVWYLKSENGDSDSSLGFCQVMRHVYKKSVKDLVEEQQKLDKIAVKDLPTTMFGCCSNNENMSLGSRIGFSDLVGTSNQEPKEGKYVLAEPKSSFYPEYLGKFNYKKPYDEGSRIAGRKIYKVRDRLAESNITNDNQNVVSRINFVEKDSEFEGIIVFHNLKPEELGALVWVMTFGEGLRIENSSKSSYYHLLGHARAFGAGAVQFELSPESFEFPSYQKLPDTAELVNDCLDKFEKVMNVNYPFSDKDDSWKQSSIVTLYLKNSEIDSDFDVKKVYNMFPGEFGEIKKDYENSPNAGKSNQQKGFYPSGKNTGPVCNVLKEEGDFSEKTWKQNVDKKRKKEEERQKVELKKRKEEQDKLEKELVAANKKNELERRLNEILDSSNTDSELYVLEVEVLRNRELCEKYREKLGFSNFNQFLKNLKNNGIEINDETMQRMSDVIRQDDELRKEAVESCKTQKKKDKNFVIASRLYDLLNN